MRKFYFILVLLLFQAALYSQDKTGTTFDGNRMIGDPGACLKAEHFEGTDEEVNNIITEMLDKIDIRNRYIIMGCSQIENCQAMLYQGRPYILFNPSFLTSVKGLNFSESKLPKSATDKDWRVLTILAHELGHHVNNHLINPLPGQNDWIKELEADEFAGNMMCRMGATLRQAQLAFINLPDQGSYTHPPRGQRLEAVAKGYNKAIPAPAPKPPEPVVKPNPEPVVKNNPPATNGNLLKAKNLLSANRLMEAKSEIDNLINISNNAQSAETWYYKCKIYASIGEDPALKTQVPDAHSQAFDALKKYTDLDETATAKAKDKAQLLLKLDGYKPVNQIYAGFFQDGANNYNNGKYSDALTDFKSAIASRDFMFSKGWITQKFDTISTLYAGIAAEKAKNREDEAALYYSKIADARLNDPKYIDIYKWLVNYFSEDKNDEKNALNYLNLGKKLYPDDPSWENIRLGIYDSELEYYRKTGNKDLLFAKYDQIITMLPNSHVFVYNYGVELYNYAVDTSSGKRPANSEDLIAKAKYELNKSLQIKPNYVQASLLLGQIAYNDAVDLRATTKNIKGQRPEDIKKRADIRADALKRFDDAIPYLEKIDQQLGSQGKLKQDDRKALKDAYDLLITIYEQKSQTEKSQEYTKKFNDVDKIH